MVINPIVCQKHREWGVVRVQIPGASCSGAGSVGLRLGDRHFSQGPSGSCGPFLEIFWSGDVEAR